MPKKKYWRQEYKYKRIMEILDDYWLTEPDELFVRVSMKFIKANGERQGKLIKWKNPNYERKDGKVPKLRLISAKELWEQSESNPDPFFEIDVNEWRKKS